MRYLCEACCETEGIDFSGDAINEVGRKHCSSCGTNKPWRLHVACDVQEK